MGLDFARLREQNAQRTARWHGPDWASADDQWTIADWSNAVCGEVGELANLIKKLRRHECSFPDAVPSHAPEELLHAIADELADVVIYSDLLATKLGLNLGDCVIQKFNRKSEEQGFSERL